MKPIRKAALVNATILEVGRTGSLDVTVGQIARRAGISPALAHHYFGSKDDLFVAAMRHVLKLYGAEVRSALIAAGPAPRARLHAIVTASFGSMHFHDDAIGAWLNFWVLARVLPDARRLLRIYHHRLNSNLVFCLRPLIGSRSPAVAAAAGAMIDGVYLRQALSSASANPAEAVAMILAMLRAEVGEAHG